MLTKTITLHAPSNSPGGKFYTVDLTPAGELFTVDFHHGAVGGPAKHGTKTAKPVTLAAASKIFDALVKSKIDGDSHYRPAAEASPEYIAPPTAAGPVCIAPRLLNDVAESEVASLCESDRWWAEIKHDGDRVQLHLNSGIVTLFSGRSGKTRPCPKRIADMLADYPSALVLDGELVGDVLWAFDVLSAVGHDFRDESYCSRYESLELILSVIGRNHPTLSGAIRLVTAARTHEEKVELIIAAKKSSAEGVVFINRLARYEAGRPSSGGDNLRWKFTASASVVVAGHNERCSIALSLGDGTPIGTCSMLGKGTLPPVGSVIEVEYLYAQGSLVQARYKGLRTDLLASDCTRGKLQFKGGVDPLAA